ncbi:suppressor of fused domain protein [Marinactinospora thermotolerans]|uniref:Suppressor of fused protein (SUFU) n=1 Tax=Marinactinospora thermotolerans DSM 45154 TaxID=1122192 RepID=A0A1T4SGB4_9ACTN|nr:suppressor of fused domain protein [Marinactinospora thermotolerans]SKA27344.1 Suppressor of fused protein (SUFU) [Marinactinospora thermotolerans DSM 45154]
MSEVRVLLDQVSPYRSRRVVVEEDARTSAAYLLDPRGEVRVPVWLANHEPAPDENEPVGLFPGQAPLMPARHTKHPQGRPRLAPESLRVVWFEEGDGVALFDGDGLLAIIPGWAEADRGLPGFAREAVGRSAYAWALDDVAAQLWPRVVHAEAYWEWRSSPNAWRTVQRNVFTHLTRTVGPAGHYWDVSDGHPPLIRVSERPTTPDRPYTVLSTVGMCGQRMPTLDRYMADTSQHARIELALATTLPAHVAARIFRWLGTFPWRAVTWFGPGHTVKWLVDPEEPPLRGDFTAVLLVSDPSVLAGPSWAPPPDTSGLRFHGDPVRWLWVVPITRPEHLFAKEHDAATLIAKLAAEGRSWVLG